MKPDLDTRTVTSRWEGGMRAVAIAGPFEMVVDEPPSAGGTDTGPQPTDLFLASVATCFTLAMAYAARKRRVALPGLRVDAVGTYEGTSFGEIEVVVYSEAPAGVVEDLIPAAERVCYVTNTLRGDLTVRIVSATANPTQP